MNTQKGRSKEFLAELGRFAQLAEGLDPDLTQKSVREALGDRQVIAFFIATSPLEGYEAERIFNAVIITEDNRFYDFVLGRNYFRFDYTSLTGIWRVFGQHSIILRETSPTPVFKLFLNHKPNGVTGLVAEGEERLKELTRFSDFLSTRLQTLGIM